MTQRRLRSSPQLKRADQAINVTAPVQFVSKLNYSFIGHFDLKNKFLDNKIK